MKLKEHDVILTKEQFIKNIERIHRNLDVEYKLGKLLGCVVETKSEWVIDSLLLMMEEDMGIEAEGILSDWCIDTYYNPEDDFIVTITDKDKGSKEEREYNLKTAEDFWNYWEKECKQ